MTKSDFPFYRKPESLTWHPSEKYAEIRYNVTDYIANVNKWTRTPLTLEHAYFSLIAYNARDFGFEYIYVSMKKSHGLSKPESDTKPCSIRQFLHCGGSSGYPGGSNNMSPFVPQISNFKIDRLPARAHLKLWKTKPTGVKDDPDMTFVIHFK